MKLWQCYSCWKLIPLSRFQISLFFDFFVFVFFFHFGTKNGPKRAREGFQRVRGGIPLLLHKVSAQMGPFGAHWGPFLFFNFPKTFLGPNSSKSIIPNEVLGPWGPGWGGACGPLRPKADFSEGCGGAEPPHSPLKSRPSASRGRTLPPNLGPRAPKPRLGLWTWSYLGPKRFLGN